MPQFQFKILPPNPALSGSVSFYFRYHVAFNQQELNSNLVHKQITLPTGYTFIGFMFSKGINIGLADKQSEISNCPIYFGGQFDQLYTMSFSCDTDIFGVVLDPKTASKILKQPICLYRNKFEEMPPQTKLYALYDQMTEVSFNERIILFEKWLINQIKKSKLKPVFTDWAVDKILKTKGRISSHNLAKSLKVSDRHLQRTFKSKIGLCPNEYANIIKLNNFVNDFNHGKYRLVDLIYEYQYFDKSHFKRQFKSVTQLSLANYLTMQNSASRHFLKNIDV